MAGATAEGTSRFFAKHAAPHARLGRTGWAVSRVGFGAYRVTTHEPAHREALRLALSTGCNLIDTAASYTNGHSEELVGETLEELFAGGALARDEVIVVTKAGYARTDKGQGMKHSLDPKFLEAELTHSLERLRLKTVDVFLLHNPEQFLKTTQDHTEYYRQLKQAFEWLEGETARGRIQNYGVSSNTLIEPKDSPAFTSLDLLLELAGEVSPSNHFAVVEFPLNLFEPGAALETNNDSRTLLELARERDLGTLTNRPLNAYNGARMVRLADFPDHAGENPTERFRHALGKAIEIEGRYPAKEVVPLREVAWGHILNSNIEKIRDIDSWRQILENEIRPTLAEAFETVAENDAWKPWVLDYRAASDKMFARLTEYFEWRESMESKSISSKLVTAAPELASSPTLSQKVVRLYQSLPGVHCVLAGMRKPEYARDLLGARDTLEGEHAVETLRNYSRIPG